MSDISIIVNEISRSLSAALDFIGLDVKLLVGFISGWLLFEVTERRKVGRARRELSNALVAELEHAEVLVSNIVMKYARLCRNETDVNFVANEIRWFYDIGRQRMQDVGILSDLPSNLPELKSLSDNQLIGLFSSVRETIGSKIILPVLGGVLVGQTLGFDTSQIRAFSMVRWQSYLLEQESESMKEMFRLTFTVTDKDNHKTVVENHNQRTVAYAYRARTLLRAIRTALQQIQKSK